MDNPPRYEIGLPTVVCTRIRIDRFSTTGFNLVFRTVIRSKMRSWLKFRRMRIYTIDCFPLYLEFRSRFWRGGEGESLDDS